MSSLVRRIQKKIAISQGYYKKDGIVYNSNDESVGLTWPQVKAPTKEKKA